MAYATLEELKNRLDWTLDEDEERIATSALEDASDLAAHYGRDWPEDSAPRMVRTLVLKACKRYLSNPDGFTQSRAGDETLMWNDAAGENAGTVYFTPDEQELLAGLAGRRKTIVSVGVTAWESKIRRGRPFIAGRKGPYDTGWVPAEGGGRPIPFYADDEEPW